MRHFVLSAALSIAAIAAPVSAHSQSMSPSMPGSMPPQIITSGTGEARVSPDRATIFIGVQSRAATAAAAGSDNARRQRAILDTLRAAGLGSDQLSTINYNVSPEMQYNQQTGTSKVIGYMVTNTVRAEVRRIDDVGKLIDAVLAKGANEISSLQFSSSKADSGRRAALAEAVANARSDAEALAKAAGGSLGPLIELSTAGSPIRPMAEQSFGQVAMAKVQTPIEPGQQTIMASVTARWAFVGR